MPVARRRGRVRILGHRRRDEIRWRSKVLHAVRGHRQDKYGAHAAVLGGFPGGLVHEDRLLKLSSSSRLVIVVAVAVDDANRRSKVIVLPFRRERRRRDRRRLGRAAQRRREQRIPQLGRRHLRIGEGSVRDGGVRTRQGPVHHARDGSSREGRRERKGSFDVER